ncbi:MAG: hypothetical protein Kow00120_30250 [Anaerolineae bacterium]
MNDIAIRVEGLGKQYRIGSRPAGYRTLRDTLADSFAAPFRRAGRLLRGQADGAAGLTETIWALKDVSFAVERGEVVGIIGRNGAGKSTLLKVLARITEPTEGCADVYGRVGSLLEVGTGFHPELTGRENIYLNGAILGMTRAEIDRKFDAIVDFAEIARFIDTPVKHYSSGMYLRLAFAVAAHLEPEILLVDEVLAVGDAAFQKKCLGKMGEVAGQGRTVLFVSHNMAAIEALCNRGLWLHDGRLQAALPTDQAIRAYLGATARALSAPLRERTDRAGNGRLRFTALQVQHPNGSRLDAVASGQDIVIRLGYEVRGGERVSQVKVGISFFGALGEFLFMCKSDLVGDLFHDLPAQGHFTCCVPRLPLPPGQYHLALWAKAGGDWTDRIEQAHRLTVVEGDFFGTGRLPYNRRGLLVPHTWRLDGAGDVGGVG